MEALVSFGTECYVSGKVMHAAGGVLGVLRSEVKLGQATEAVAAMAGEQAGLSEAGRELAQTMQKMEQVAQEKVAQETAKKLIDAEKQLEKGAKVVSSHGVETVRQSTATPPRTAADKAASALRKAERLVDKKVELPDGRIRYYELEKLSDTPGPTRGRSYVTEFAPKTGRVRQWNECYDHAGNVNRIRPTMINGRDVLSQHYPATYKDIQNNIKGSKWRIPEKTLD